MRRILIRSLLALVASLLLLLAGGWLYLRSSLPETEGVRRLAGIDAEVSIARDGRGIPHISAENMADATFAIGYLHAQDRLWQMEMNRRIAAGRLSEFAGAATVEADKYLRTLSLYERARRSWRHQSPETQALLRAYADGINAFLEDRSGALPPEFLLTGVEPEPWTPIDSLGWIKMMALDLGGNMRSELARLDLLSVLDEDQLKDFLPPYPGDAPLTLPDLGELYDGLPIEGVTEAAKTALYGLPDALRQASNNWALSGLRTESGKPLLANDPHLGLTTPALWYLAHLEIAGRDLAGYTFPGAPFLVLGHNGHVAWAFTNFPADVQDLYLEKVVRDGEAYLTPEGPRRFVTREEVIAVDGTEPVRFTVRETRHGPVISDVNEEVRERLPENTVLALRWTALDEDDTTPSMAPAAMQARNALEFRKALRSYVAPPQNIVFADADGSIGLIVPGRIPMRGPDNDTHGLIPAPGWKPGYDWQGYIPFEELPQSLNPSEGVIVTANAKTIPEDYPHFVTTGWALPYRRHRIEELLRMRPRHDASSLAAIQMDVRSGVAEDLLPRMLAHLEVDEDGLAVALRDWDREMRVDAPEPLIYAAWHRHLVRRIAADELGEAFERHRGKKILFLKAVLDGETAYANWCDDIGTEPLESCRDTVTAAFRDALGELEERFGADWRDWRWGEAHQVIQSHRPFSQVPFLGRFFELRAPARGGTYTVNVATPRFSGDRPYAFSHAPSFRAVYDLADLASSRYVLPAGQSGNPLSSHYDDMLPLWLAGASVTIPLGPPDPGWDLLILRPAREN